MTTSGVAKYIQLKKKLLDTASSASPKSSELEASVAVEGRSGIRRIRVRDFQIVSDGTPAGGGFNLGPFPGELLVASVAACLTHGYLIEAAKAELVLDAVHVSASATIPATGIDPGAAAPVDLNWRYTAQLTSPETPETLEQLRRTVERNSFVYNVVTRGAPITGSLDITPSSATDERGR